MNRLIAVLLFTSLNLRAADVQTVRVPDGGIQPRAAMDSSGLLHLVYYKGDPAHGDLFYVRSNDNGVSFSRPIRVNSQDGSAIAIGSIRGAQMALGRNNRVFVAWNGSSEAEPKGPGKQPPMLFARLDAVGAGFEPQRNVIASHYGLDGGGSVAADGKGNVYVVWHAPDKPKADESSRQVWVAKSTDDGKSFSPESEATSQPTGACGCCGLKSFADSQGGLYVLYRSASEMVHRDMYLLSAEDGATFQASRIAPMEIGQCIMSSADVIQGKAGVLAAWETNGKVFWSAVSPHGAGVIGQIATPASGKGQKYPSLASGSDGSVLLAWAEGTGWNRGGSIAWQLYDSNQKPVGKVGGLAGLATWSFPAAVATKEGGYLVLY